MGREEGEGGGGGRGGDEEEEGGERANDVSAMQSSVPRTDSEKKHSAHTNTPDQRKTHCHSATAFLIHLIGII